MNSSLSSQIFASVQDVLNCGLAGSTCGHFKDYSCVAQWPLHKHCTNLHSCQPPQLVKTVCPFPLHSLLVTVIGVCVRACVRACVCAHACACVLAHLMVVMLNLNAVYHLLSLSPLSALFPILRKIIQLHCREKNHTAYKSTEEN